MPDTPERQAPAAPPVAASPVPPPRALVFDVFGTVVDWHGSVSGEVRRRGLPVDADDFARAWRAGYAPAMDEVRRGAVAWTTIDVLHRRILDRLLESLGLTLPDAEAAALNGIWHRLDPWPDSVPGLWRLKRRWPLATLSNGNLSLLVDLARHGALPFDAVLSAELFGHYKPDPEVYRGAARLLDVPPASLMLVAAHPSDLDAAARCGLQTAFVARPDEHGRGAGAPAVAPGRYTVSAGDFLDLARQLGA
jgi:2-haloacid dehalogenase